jgi:hypothetical protein
LTFSSAELSLPLSSNSESVLLYASYETSSFSSCRMPYDLFRNELLLFHLFMDKSFLKICVSSLYSHEIPPVMSGPPRRKKGEKCLRPLRAGGAHGDRDVYVTEVNLFLAEGANDLGGQCQVKQ